MNHSLLPKNVKQKMVQYVLTVVFMLSFLLSGCGYHLRGQVALAPSLKAVALKTEANNLNSLTYEIREQLKNIGADIVPSAPIELYILSLDFKEEAITQSSGYDNTDYQQVATLTWYIVNTKGLALFEPQKIIRTRRYQRNSNHYNSAEYEAAQNRSALQKELVSALISQLAGIKESQLQQIIKTKHADNANDS